MTQLYRVQPKDRPPVHVVAHTPRQAADVFVTWDALWERMADSFTVDAIAFGELSKDQKDSVRDAIESSLAGVAHFEAGMGWTFSPVMWSFPHPVESGTR